jgi:hypothetical protein
MQPRRASPYGLFLENGTPRNSSTGCQRPANAFRAIHDQSLSVPFRASRVVTPVPSRMPTGNFCPKSTFHVLRFTPMSSPNCTFSAPFLRCFQRRYLLPLAPQPLPLSTPKTAQFLACRAGAQQHAMLISVLSAHMSVPKNRPPVPPLSRDMSRVRPHETPVIVGLSHCPGSGRGCASAPFFPVPNPGSILQLQMPTASSCKTSLRSRRDCGGRRHCRSKPSALGCVWGPRMRQMRSRRDGPGSRVPIAPLTGRGEAPIRFPGPPLAGLACSPG